MDLLTKTFDLGGPLLLGAVTTVAITLAALLVAIVLGLALAGSSLDRVGRSRATLEL